MLCPHSGRDDEYLLGIFQKGETVIRCLVIVLSVILCMAAAAWGLEWKPLHEAADQSDQATAMANLAKNPTSPEAHYILGLVYLNLHKNREADAVFSQMLSSFPQSSEARWGKAEVLRRQHMTKESDELLQSILKTDPGFAPAYITLAYIRYYQMRFNEAARLATNVLQMGEGKVDQSTHVRAHLMLSGAKGMIAHYGGPISKLVNGTAVVPHLRRAEELQPDSVGVLFGFGSYYLLAPRLVGGDRAKAEEYLKKAIAVDPLFADTYVRLAQLYRLKGDRQAYTRLMQKAREIDPQNILLNDARSGACKFICVGINDSDTIEKDSR